MAIKKDYIYDDPNSDSGPITITNAFFRLAYIGIGDDNKTDFYYSVYKSKNKYLAGQKPLEKNLRVSVAGTNGFERNFIMNCNINKNPRDQIDEYVLTLPGWETGIKVSEI